MCAAREAGAQVLNKTTADPSGRGKSSKGRKTMNVRKAARFVMGALTLCSVVLASGLMSAETLQSTTGFAIAYGLTAAMIPLLALLAEESGTALFR